MWDDDVSLEQVYVGDMESSCWVLWCENVLCVVCVSDLSMNMYHVFLCTLDDGSSKIKHSWELHTERRGLTRL